MEAVRIGIFCSECTEHCRVHLRAIGIQSLRSSSLECEVVVGCLHKVVFTQAVEGVCEVIQGMDVRITKGPRCKRQTDVM